MAVVCTNFDTNSLHLSGARTITITGEIDEFRVDYTVQQEWRVLILIAFFSGSVGSSAFLLSQLLGFARGMVAGLAIVGIVKGGAHLVYLGRPARFFRAFAHPQTSWISRGMIGLAVLMASGVLYVLPFFPSFGWLPWTPNSLLGQTLGAFAFAAGLLVMVYTALVTAAPPSIPFWNTALLPILFLVYGIIGGTDVLLILQAVAAVPALGSFNLELLELCLISLALVTVFTYLGLMSTGSPVAKRAAQLLLNRRLGYFFLGGVVALGLIIPLLLGLYAYFAAPQAPWIVAVQGVLVMIGGLALRWVVLKAGVCAPVC